MLNKQIPDRTVTNMAISISNNVLSYTPKFKRISDSGTTVKIAQVCLLDLICDTHTHTISLSLVHNVPKKSILNNSF